MSDFLPRHKPSWPMTRAEVRDVDRRALEQYGIPGVVLMENAGRGAAELLLSLGARGPVVICAGKGNNGGDGFVMARHLDGAGIAVRVLLFCDPSELTRDAAVHYGILQAAGLAGSVYRSVTDPLPLERELASADWIVDALLGTGAKGPARPPLSQVIEAINRSGRFVLAVDIPSGLDCDTGEPLGACVKAHHTVTFVARKIGFEMPGALGWTGQVSVAPIGIPRKLVTDLLREFKWPAR
ncbi:MAG: NAD(P)H-hydrate epimerase [Planctomycetales bacterium]